jgi:glycosyltransferase involved in cell wall biosynthesis
MIQQAPGSFKHMVSITVAGRQTAHGALPSARFLTPEPIIDPVYRPRYNQALARRKSMATVDTYVIVPTYNEADNIDDLVQQLLDLPVRLGVIVVDDNSPDGTGRLADAWREREPDRVHVVHRPGKMGLGTAYIAGFRYGLEERQAARLLTMDADFSHNPRYIPDMIELSRTKDVVIGSRYVPGGGTRYCTWKRIVLSRIANTVARTLLSLQAHDTTAGFRLYHRRVLESIPLDEIFSSGYSFLVEMLFMCQRRGWQIGEVPIIFEDRRKGATKISRQEVLKAQYTVFRLFFRRITGRAPRYSAPPDTV